MITQFIYNLCQNEKVGWGMPTLCKPTVMEYTWLLICYQFIDCFILKYLSDIKNLFFFSYSIVLQTNVISQAPHHMLHYGRVGEVLRSCTWFIGMLYLIWRAWNCTYHLSSEAYDDFPWHSNQSPLKHWSSEAYCCTKMSIRCNLLSSWYLQSRKDY